MTTLLDDYFSVKDYARRMFKIQNKIPMSYFSKKKTDEEFELIIEIYNRLKELPTYIYNDMEDGENVDIAIDDRFGDLLEIVEEDPMNLKNIDHYREMVKLIDTLEDQIIA
jgi:hypothetical protein